MEFKELIGNRNGMSGVVPAIKAGDDIRIPGEQVDNPTLALIPPLRSDRLKLSPFEYWIVNLDCYCSLNPEGAIIEAQGL